MQVALPSGRPAVVVEFLRETVVFRAFNRTGGGDLIQLSRRLLDQVKPN